MKKGIPPSFFPCEAVALLAVKTFSIPGRFFSRRLFFGFLGPNGSGQTTTIKILPASSVRRRDTQSSVRDADECRPWGRIGLLPERES